MSDKDEKCFVEEQYFNYKTRMEVVNQIDYPYRIKEPDTVRGSLEYFEGWAKELCALGWEGVFAVHASHVYQPGRRVNTAVKIKARPTADLRCIQVLEGEGKYAGMIGSLRLRDSEGREVDVGSGLSDADRDPANTVKFLAAIIEIKYEQILDTYIQPTFERIREDKNCPD